MSVTDQKPVIIPGLCEWKQQAGRFTITAGSRLMVHQQSEENLKATADYFQQELQRVTGLSLSSELVIESEPGSTPFDPCERTWNTETPTRSLTAFLEFNEKLLTNE